MPFQVPWHLQREPWRNPYAGNITQLMMRQGEIAGERAARSGEIWGSAIQSLGQIGAGAVERYGQQKAEEKKQAALGQFLRSGEWQDPAVALEGSISLLGEKEGPKFAESLLGFQQLGEGIKQGRIDRDTKNLGLTIRGMEMLDEKTRAEAWPDVVTKAAPVLQALQIPAEAVGMYDSKRWPEISKWGRSLLGEKAATPEDYTLGPGQKRFKAGGIAEAEVAPKLEKPEDLSLEEKFLVETDPVKRAKMLRDRAAYAGAGREPPKPVEGLPPLKERRVNQLADKFAADPIVKRANTVAEGYAFVSSLDPKTSNPADDQALIYAFAKAMDPDSAVREGEYATVQKYAQSWAQRFKFDAVRVLSNTEFLTPEARANIKAAIRSKFEASRKGYENARTQYGKQINLVTGRDDGLDYLLDYGAGYPVDAPKPYLSRDPDAGTPIR